MTGHLLLDWAIMGVSLSNTILLIWLGLTVLFNAQRRTWGTLLAVGGLLLGGLFFISHSAILGYGWTLSGVGLNLWWWLGLTPVVLLPFVWYLMMLWYSGFWGKPKNRLSHRHMPWLLGLVALSILLIALMVFDNPIPTYSDYSSQGLVETVSLGGIPLLFILYPFYVIICVSLALDALQHPGPSERVMGDLARRRARPWLAGTSLALLFVSFLITAVFVWVFRYSSNPREIFDHAVTIGLFDLAIEGLIGLAVVLLGQAIVAYEIFTGKALPRRGLLRQWQRALLLAVGYGATISLTINLALRPIYGLLLTALLMTGFYAMLSWRSYSDRERYIQNLRPFVTSQGIFDFLINQNAREMTEVEIDRPFIALCRDVLETTYAHLVAVGPLAPLMGSSLVYPRDSARELPPVHELVDSFTLTGPGSRFVPVSIPGGEWAVPLWSERGLIGVLILGEKMEGSLYTQEEIEIAQTTCERLIDTKASVEIAQRLMALQRERLAESQLLDQRARRILHDDVLQQLHAAMLILVGKKNGSDKSEPEAINLLSDVHTRVSNLLRELPSTSLPEITSLGLIGAIKEALDTEFVSAFDAVEWDVHAGLETRLEELPSLIQEVLFYASREAIRNAAKHGRSPTQVNPYRLTIRLVDQNGPAIQIEDNGAGFSAEEGRPDSNGQGLALHSTMMAVIGGELTIESEAQKFTRVSLRLPKSNLFKGDYHERPNNP